MLDRDRCEGEPLPAGLSSTPLRPSVLALAPLACLLFFLYLVFLHSYATFFARYFPRHFDQVAQLTNIYGAYYSISVAHTLDSAMHDLWVYVFYFKGWVFSLISLVLMWLFGSERTVLASANFLMLSAVIVTAFMTVRSIYSVRAAWLIVALLLLSNSVYMFPGGLSDIRLDLAGLATFGIFVLMLLKLRNDPHPPNLISAVLAFILTTSTRSITGVYGLCTASLLLVVDTVRHLVSNTPTSLQQMKNSLWLWVGIAGSFVIFVALFWHSLSAYYLGHLSSDLNIRLGQYGVRNRSELASYYLLSAGEHFWVMIVAFGCIGAIQASCLLVLGRGRTNGKTDISEPSARLASALTITGAAILGVFAPLSSYSPSPIVIGVLTVPLGCLIVASQQALSEYLQQKSLDKWIAKCAMVAGAGYFVLNHVTGISDSLEERNWLRQHNIMYRQIFEDFGELGGKVGWATLEDGAFSLVFNVFLYESGAADAVPRFAQRDINLFPMGIDQIRSMIEDVDAFVVWSNPPVGFTYPSVVSLLDTQGQWQPIVDHEFVARREVHLNAGRFVYYLRTPRAIGVYAPNGLEEIQGKTGPERMFFWLDNRFAEINVENLRSDMLPATLSMKVLPGPSFSDQTSRTIRLMYGDQQWELRVNAETGWRLEVPLQVSPGRSQIKLLALDPPGERLIVPRDSRLITAMVTEIRLRGRGR